MLIREENNGIAHQLASSSVDAHGLVKYLKHTLTTVRGAIAGCIGMAGGLLLALVGWTLIVVAVRLVEGATLAEVSHTVLTVMHRCKQGVARG
ncbi:MAG: hypothetical protein OXH63_12245 [Gemmatimonadetes bacterium]|nr:hypothetical protein [Gemmatimonadota bacterium]